MVYMNWGPHQPSTSYEECVAVIKHGFWGDKQCIDNNHILCQIVNDTVATASPVSPTESLSTYTEDDIRSTTTLHTAMKTTKSMSTGSQSNDNTSSTNLCRTIWLSFSIVNNGCASNTHCSPFTFSNHTLCLILLGTLAGIVSGVTLMLVITAVLLLFFIWRR